MKGIVKWCSEEKTSAKGNKYYSFLVETDIGRGFGISTSPVHKNDEVNGLWDFGGKQPCFKLPRD